MSFLYDPLTTFLTGLDFMGVALIILRVLVAIVLIYVLFPGVRTYSARSGCGLAPKICTVYLLLFWGFRVLQPFITSLAVQCLSLLDAYQACALPAVFALGLCLQFPRLDSLAAARVSLRFAEAACIWDWLFDVLLVSTCWLWIASRKSGILARRLLISACRRLLGPALLKVALWLLGPSLELLAPVLDPLSANLAKWNPLSAQVAEQASIISTLEARLADVQQQLQQRNVAVADADITIADLIETMNATVAQLTEKQEMITFTHAATIDLERNLTIHGEQMAAVMESLRLLETESAAEAAINRETMQQKEESERRVESLTEALRDAREQLRVAQLNGTPPTVQTEEANAALQAIIVRLEAEQDKKDDETRALQDQLNAAQAKLLKVEAHILDNELSEAESKATLLTMEVQHDLKVQNMTRDLQNVQGQLEIAQRRASAFERQSIDKQVKEQELQAEVRRLETVDADHRLNILRREHAHRSELESILEIVTKQDVHIKRWQAQYASQEAALAHKERLIASRDDEIVTLSASNSVASDCHALSHKDATSATTAATPFSNLVDAAIQTADVPTSESALSFSLSFSLELPHLDAKRSKWFMQDEREVVDFNQAMASSLSSALSWSGAFNSSPPRSLEGLNLVAEGMVPASSSTSPNTDGQLELASKPAKQLTYDDFFSPEREGHSTLRPTANADADDLTPVRSSPCSLLDLDLVAEGMVPANGSSSSSTDGQLEVVSKSAYQPTSEDIFSLEREGHSTLRPTANADLEDLAPLRPSLPSDDMSFEIADKLRDMSCDLLHDDFSFLAKGEDDSFWMKDDEGAAEGLARVADTYIRRSPSRRARNPRHDAALPSDTFV
ncbi:hypothetical protein BN946_scf184760.g19 [Trametes cinnabarina]|uniref:Uncharacterized protein n=1 Tax=Pycnoporus cinnabarinus TaxID=5643 RepID=A0A060S7U2_PYCCI|nr:hypothetical protein BN946_scf184760.g19 [Trametes cinnabarina]